MPISAPSLIYTTKIGQNYKKYRHIGKRDKQKKTALIQHTPWMVGMLAVHDRNGQIKEQTVGKRIVVAAVAVLVAVAPILRTLRVHCRFISPATFSVDERAVVLSG